MVSLKSPSRSFVRHETRSLAHSLRSGLGMTTFLPMPGARLKPRLRSRNLSGRALLHSYT